MSLRKANTGLVLVVLLLTSLETVEASALGKAAARGAASSVAKSVNKGLTQKLSQDLVRDRKTVVCLLKRDSRVFRYTHNASSELRTGLRPGAHTTTKITPGRPLTAANAQSKYGLPTKPNSRLNLLLPKGTPYRTNKVLGGKPGVPEMSLPNGAAASTIEKNIHLR